MTTISIMDIRNELTHFLRNSDVFSIAVRGVTTASNETFTATNLQTVFTLAHIPVRNIRSLTVNSVAKYYLRDYNVNFNTGVVTLSSPCTTGWQVIFTYDYGSGDKIFPDFPREDLQLTSFPRIGIEMTSLSTEPLGLGGNNHISDMLFTVILAVPVNVDTAVSAGYGGLTAMEGTWNLIRNAIRTNAKSFYTFSWIYPKGTGPLFRGQNDKILQQTADFMIKWKIE
jgi:hypothetical protein